MTEHDMNRRRFLVLGAGAAAIGPALTACSDSSGGGKDGAAGGAQPSASASAGGAAGTAQCVLSTNVTQGPYYLDKALVRRDIREGKAGVPLTVRLTVQDTTASCNPVAGAAVEIWHCDAWGYYSGYTTASPGGNAPAESEDTSGANDKTYLRGYRIAGADGVVEFATIVPGWYTPRVTHIHVKVHTGGQQADGTYQGGKTNFTGQLFFDDAIGEAVYQLAPYTRHTGTPTKLAGDMVYTGGGAKDGLMTVTAVDSANPAAGYVGTLTLGIDPSANRTDGGGQAPGGQAPGGGAPGGQPPTGRPPQGGPPPEGAQPQAG
jgi:protocatechuate 3,4-dioxygenase beta subunit